jgi:chorismate--pyruvate lyase
MLQQKSRSPSIWKNTNRGVLQSAPRFWQTWLADTGSLTAKLEQQLNHKLSVQVLVDRNQNVLKNERHFFNRPLRRCRVREVLLSADQTPLVLARSIIPVSSASGSNQFVLKLGRRPLGAVLFARKKGKKHNNEREMICLKQSHPLWQSCKKKYPLLPNKLWARRTLYQLKNHPLLVNEIFLPTLEAKLKELER